MECAICMAPFLDLADLIRHLKSHVTAPETSAFSCQLCSKKFIDIRKLCRHLRRCHSEKQYICSECGKAFISLHKLNIHMLSHSSFAEFLCSHCGKRFKRRDKLVEHINRMHSNPCQEKCRVMKQNTSNSKRFRYPKLTAEEMAKFPFKCSICCVGFHRRGILVNHMARIHPEINTDSVCDLKAPVLQQQVSFRCHYCDRTYMSNGKRKRHILSYHPRATMESCSRLQDTKDLGYVAIEPKLCTLCPSQFLTNAKLLQHLRKQHDIVTNNP